MEQTTDVQTEERMACPVRPAADIEEQDDAFVVRLDMPGSAKDVIRINIENDTLEISGTMSPRPDATTKFLRSEIGIKTYARSFNLGPGIDRERIEAAFEDGVLTVMLPKSETVKAKEIHIN